MESNQMLADKLTNNYYKIKNAQKDTMRLRKEQGIKKFCSLCFKPNCNHTIGKDTYEDVLPQLGWWADIIRCYLPDRVINDEVIPLWPKRMGTINPSLPYLVTPSLDSELVGVLIDDYGIYGIRQDGTAYINLSYFMSSRKDKIGNGIYWGYWIEECFWMVYSFRDGVWQDIQRLDRLPRIPYSDSLTTINVPKGMRDLVTGYWYLPDKQDHLTFSSHVYWSDRL